MTFSHPWTADEDLADYEHRLGAGDRGIRPVSWSIAPRLGGLQLSATF